MVEYTKKWKKKKKTMKSILAIHEVHSFWTVNTNDHTRLQTYKQLQIPFTFQTFHCFSCFIHDLHDYKYITYFIYLHLVLHKKYFGFRQTTRTTLKHHNRIILLKLNDLGVKHFLGILVTTTSSTKLFLHAMSS